MSTTTTPTDSKKRVEELTRTLEFKWFACHVGVVFGTLLTILFSVFTSGKIVNFFYRTSLVAAIGSFAIILKQKFGSRIPPPAVILSEDNFQYLLVCTLWVFTTRRILALLPVAIYSVFHVLTYSRSYLLPALGYHETSPLVKRIEVFVKERNEQLTYSAAGIEFLLLIELLFKAITFRKGSWIQTAGYLLFFRRRYISSSYTRRAVKGWEVRIDQALGHPSLPPAAKQYWLQFKHVVSRGFGQAPATTTTTTAGGSTTTTSTGHSTATSTGTTSTR